MTSKTIYNMDLHEIMEVVTTSVNKVACPTCAVMRVPEGWIYMFWCSYKQEYIREVFVPFDNVLV